jgi:bla regulator protein blaR1
MVAAIAAQSQDAPDWQTAAGGKMSFEIASVKPAKTFIPPNFPLGADTGYTPGGRLSAIFPLSAYITFAYKLRLTPEQSRAVFANVPKWVGTDLFEIRAEASGNPTKDQMRLMMQSLLADRFQLRVHFEKREVPVLALTLDKPGKLGPRLRPHSEGPPCPEQQSLHPASRLAQSVAADVFPAMCHVTGMKPASPGLLLVASRDTTMELLAGMVQTNGSTAGELEEPVVDRTGLNGTFDYSIEYGGALGPVQPPEPDAPPPESTGPTFLQALRDQLGLKLAPSRAPIRTISIDHVEKPSEN